MKYFILPFFLTLSLCVSFLARAEIRVIDTKGREITLAKPAQRIIALAPHITENAYSAGLEGSIIAVVNHSDFPEAAKTLPQVGSYNSISIEAIIALKPDLILSWRSGNNRATIERLIALGYPVYIDEPRNFDDIAKSIRDYATLGGKPKVGEETAGLFLEEVTALKKQYAAKKPVRTFYQVWNEPLQTLNGKHLISTVISVCGGINIFADSPAIAPIISKESVIHLNPEVIVASGMGESRPEWLDQWRQLDIIDAVKMNHLRHIHPDLLQRHTTRIAQGTKHMCEALDSAR